MKLEVIMYIGIKYEQRLKSVNKQLNNFGSALMFHVKTKYYFKNPIYSLPWQVQIHSPTL